jgi:arginyl-tRNA synthetase
MTREQAKAAAEAQVDHTLFVLVECIKELSKQYSSIYGHEHVMAAHTRIRDARGDLDDLLTAVNSAQTARVAAE